MPVPAFRNSRSRVRRRRSHHALKPVTVNKCVCGADVLMHRACLTCGTYNKRQVKGGMQVVEKALAKETEAKAAAPAKKPRAAAKPKAKAAPKAE